jgi:hypothetical protein
MPEETASQSLRWDSWWWQMTHDHHPFEDEIAIAKFKRYKSAGGDQMLVESIQGGGKTLFSEIHKLINSIGNKE